MESFFKTYAQGYIDRDFKQIEPHFAYPCMLTNQSGTDLICDSDDLEQHVMGFLAMLDENDLAKAIPTIVHDELHGSDNRVITVKWRMFAATDEAFAEFEYLYVLVGGEGNWKISLANLI